MYEADGVLPHSKMPLASPKSEFPAVIIGPNFCQVSSCVFDPQLNLLTYLADSQMGDCGQPIIDSETNEVVGLHIGRNKSLKNSRIGYGLAFDPKSLRELDTTLGDLGF